MRTFILLLRRHLYSLFPQAVPKGFIAKAILFFAMAAALYAALPACGAAAQAAYPDQTPQLYANDFAGVLSAQQKQYLIETGKTLERKTGVQAVAVTVGSLQGESIETYALNLSQKWALGRKNKGNAVLLLLATGDKKIRIEVGAGLGRALDASMTDKIRTQAMLPSLRKGDYGAGLSAGYRAIASEVYRQHGMTPPKDPGSGSSSGSTALILTVSALLLAMVLTRGKLPGRTAGGANSMLRRLADRLLGRRGE